MHPAVRDYVKKVLEENGLVPYADVLEVGSYDVNGSVRDLFRYCHQYTGMDARPGPGVDVVADIEERVISSGQVLGALGLWDVVVSTEMLEHTPRPWLAVLNMARCLKPGGRLILTTRAPGFGLHEHPGDFYRFTPSALEVLCEEAGLEEICAEWELPELEGAFVTAVAP